MVIAHIVPPGVVVEECCGSDDDAPWPEELASIAGAAAGRQREFLLGRACARRALKRLGRPETAIPVGRRREPLWPSGVVGSITHCDGYCAAAVGEKACYRSIGIDAEHDHPLPGGVLRLVATESEKDMLSRLSTSCNADTLLFSIKESVFKAWYPMVGIGSDLRGIVVTIDPATQTFRARQSAVNPEIAAVAGRYIVDDGVIGTAVVVM